MFSVRVTVKRRIRNNSKKRHWSSPCLRLITWSSYQRGPFCTSYAKLRHVYPHQGHFKISLAFKWTFWVRNRPPQQEPDGWAERIAMTKLSLVAFSKPFPCWLQFNSTSYSVFIQCVILLRPDVPRLTAVSSVLEAPRETYDWLVTPPFLKANGKVIWHLHLSFVILLFEDIGLAPDWVCRSVQLTKDILF